MSEITTELKSAKSLESIRSPFVRFMICVVILVVSFMFMGMLSRVWSMATAEGAASAVLMHALVWNVWKRLFLRRHGRPIQVEWLTGFLGYMATVYLYGIARLMVPSAPDGDPIVTFVVPIALSFAVCSCVVATADSRKTESQVASRNQ